MTINLLYSKLDPPPPPKNPLAVALLALLILSILAPAGFLVWRQLQPTGSYLNPLPRGTQAANTDHQSLDFYLTTAQGFLDKAVKLANSNSQQTPQDKQLIIATLNQALSAANQAISHYPQAPSAYQERANILFSVAPIHPQVKPLAEQDLQTAQALASQPGSQSTTLPAANPIETLPIEQASLAQNVVIAAPESDSNLPDIALTKSSVTKSTAILPAGQQELKIENEKLKIDSVIYLIPQTSTQNHTVYVKSKTDSFFTIAVDQPLDTDLNLDYWIVNN